MNYRELPLADLLANLPPEVRRDFDLARFRLALEGATDAEVTAALVTFGYLVRLFAGTIHFDRWQLRQYVRMTEDDPKRPNRKAKTLSSSPADQ
ncbi:hypothetical protein BECAL_02229 [Bellilinea caldifistulae]|uniref:Uncharacterized protein n=1 Tax=Bellilinea caldifistulae TaxID=360411 RepID=A0A0P6XG26_9CHLR|nr:hypothetical protein [Bellilinea caldifistulae]KPL73783.1 hypothetical protein AC812_13355 [Bellilinea caldifistulae]GAP11047.1 hypothetical protein BECAL_02229 [Bellilinea caldifistulae]